MDHGGEAARPTTVESTDHGMAGAVQGGEENMSTGTFHGQLSAAAARRAAAYHNSVEFARHVRAASGGAVPVAVFHREPGPGVVYTSIGASWQQPGPAGAVLVGHDSYFYSALQTRQRAGRGVVLAALLPGGVDAVYNGDCPLQLRPGAGHGELLVDLLPDGAGHGEVFDDQLPGSGVALHDDYGYYPWQPHPGAGRGEVFIGPLPDGVVVVFDSLGNFAQQTLLGTRRADGIVGVLRDRDHNIGAGYDGSGALAVYDNPGMVGERLCRLLPFAGTGACSMAVNGLAAGPGSPAVAFHLFVLFLAGLFLVMLHVLGVQPCPMMSGLKQPKI